MWQAFAAKNRLAIVACRFTDKPHDQNFIEDYVNVSHGSGQALLDILGKFAGRSNHAEIASAPLLLWGMSAGGQFDYEFTAWHPERVAAFVVNKGGIYYTALTSRAARAVPGILFIGGKDLDQRVRDDHRSVRGESSRRRAVGARRGAGRRARRGEIARRVDAVLRGRAGGAARRVGCAQADVRSERRRWAT